VVERLIQNTNEAGPLLILGWYNYHHGNPARGLELFKTALDRNGGTKAAEGYAMSLRALERLSDAEAFAYEWRERAPENMKIYLDVATALLSQDPPPRLEPPVIARIVPVVTAQRFSDAAQALGWYSYNTEQIRTARDWFRTALTWKADDEASAYGLALTTQRLTDRAGFNAVVAQWRGRSQRIADLADGANPASRRQPVVTQPVVAQAPMPEPIKSPPPPVQPRQVTVERVETEQTFARTEDNVRRRQTQARSALGRNCAMTRNPAGLSGDSALTRGWCLMEINRPMEAVAAFDQATATGSSRAREEAAYGKSLAYLRKNLTSEAAIAAAEAPQTRERRVELGASILTQRALAAYRDGRYVETLLALSERARIVPEQNDLLLIRGWSYLKLGRYNDAEKVFRAVQQTGYSEEAAAGLNAIREVTGQIRY
jgi:cellulose synthase operon protein C